MRIEWKISLLLFVVIALISGCVETKQGLKPQAEGKLKVMYYGEEAFRNKYGNYFNLKFPNIELEVVDLGEFENDNRVSSVTDVKKGRRFIEKEKPDIIMFDEKWGQELFCEYIQKGRLYNLDAKIAQDQFDLKGYMPGYIDMLREQGNGSIYGLSPFFTPKVIFYNKNIFKQYGILLPKNQMTWEEIINLSNQFSHSSFNKNKVYGMSIEIPDDDIVSVVESIAESETLRILDPKSKKIRFDSEKWKHIITSITDAIRKKSMNIPEDKSPPAYQSINLDSNFLGGKAAMTMDTCQEIEAIANDLQKNTFGFVTAPVTSMNRNESVNVVMSQLFAISNDSKNKKEAWEFIKLINSPELAKATSKTIRGSFSTRNQFIRNIYGHRADPIYMVRPKNHSLWNGIPDPGKIEQLLREALQSIIENKKTIDEAIAELQQKAQHTLMEVQQEKQQRKQ